MSNEMTSINHHPSDAILMAYSAGTLPEAFNLMVAAHISLCDECRARVESFDAIGGAVLETGASNAIAMSDDAFAATMALISGGADASQPIRSPITDLSLLPL